MLSKNSQFEHSFKIEYRSIPISRKPFSWYMGKIRSNKRAANAAYLQTTAANQAIKHN
jgi:hypothetical protein